MTRSPLGSMTPTTKPTLCFCASIRSTRICRMSESDGTDHNDSGVWLDCWAITVPANVRDRSKARTTDFIPNCPYDILAEVSSEESLMYLFIAQGVDRGGALH